MKARELIKQFVITYFTLICYFLWFVCYTFLIKFLFILSFLAWSSLQDEKELLENNCCPMHLKPCIKRKEDNFFFALSKYQKSLEDMLACNPDFVKPSYRLNEVSFRVLHSQDWWCLQVLVRC